MRYAIETVKIKDGYRATLLELDETTNQVSVHSIAEAETETYAIQWILECLDRGTEILVWCNKRDTDAQPFGSGWATDTGELDLITVCEIIRHNKQSGDYNGVCD